ncbi:hypothetical protein DYBT9623_01500 [Dyadobacter sp. CECT 9623]|uniref:Secretion system C-terminal sorting domain-containing protein n=1 Tax=Dyadobacter linearis TaxID=2823330 RepID=A0ABN7R6F9_9BACT|nr:hypothetical protein DYBT9623_01500 [Dyadobacter sp. CECT 9623]
MNKTSLLKFYILTTVFTCGKVLAQQPAEEVGAKHESKIFFYPDQQEATLLFRSELVFFPNPASNDVAITVKGVAERVLGEGFEMKIYNQAGLLMNKRNWSAGQKLNVSQFTSGTYVIVITRENQIYSQKLVVKK